MQDYKIIQKTIHWLMAFVIMLDLNVAQKFGGEMELWDRLESRADHATMGLIITFLFILRIILRFRYGAPTLSNSTPKWQVIASQVGHYGLYFLMGTLMLTGIISANFASDPIMVFSYFDLAFAKHNDELFLLVRGIHEFCTNAIIALIAVHILAALYHHFIVKDVTTINMLKFWKG
jgi:cytochrome b561|tara:strand:- start:320 stop:850 length:531 start_codon:yes stop_codon:yes gene_type:complete